MPLVTSRGFAVDTYRRLEPAEEPTAAGDVIVPIDRLVEGVPARAGRLGADVPNTARIEDVMPVLDRLDLVCLSFPSFTDGRSFSLARQIRAAGFAGELRATGSILPDQLQFMMQVGFDSFEVSDRHPPESWLGALASMSLSYQTTGGGVRHVWRERLARAGAALQASAR